MTNRLRDKVVLITGAASGIGRATALACAQEAATVIAMDVSDAQVHLVAKELEALGCRCIATVGDVTHEADCARIVDEVVARFGEVTGVVNCAGIAPRSPLALTTVSEWDRVIDVNLRGAFLICRDAVRAMRAKKHGGSLVLIASIFGVVGMSNLTSYAASKGGVIGLVRQFAVELAPDGIRANAICPGATDTPLFRNRPDLASDPGLLDRVIADYPLLRFHGRLIRPEEIASGAVFLLSDEAMMVTGTALPIDGGYLAQ